MRRRILEMKQGKNKSINWTDSEWDWVQHLECQPNLLLTRIPSVGGRIKMESVVRWKQALIMLTVAAARRLHSSSPDYICFDVSVSSSLPARACSMCHENCTSTSVIHNIRKPFILKIIKVRKCRRAEVVQRTCGLAASVTLHCDSVERKNCKWMDIISKFISPGPDLLHPSNTLESLFHISCSQRRRSSTAHPSRKWFTSDHPQLHVKWCQVLVIKWRLLPVSYETQHRKTSEGNWYWLWTVLPWPSRGRGCTTRWFSSWIFVTDWSHAWQIKDRITTLYLCSHTAQSLRLSQGAITSAQGSAP